jgi:hypothetical protein
MVLQVLNTSEFVNLITKKRLKNLNIVFLNFHTVGKIIQIFPLRTREKITNGLEKLKKI